MNAIRGWLYGKSDDNAKAQTSGVASSNLTPLNQNSVSWPPAAQASAQPLPFQQQQPAPLYQQQALPRDISTGTPLSPQAQQPPQRSNETQELHKAVDRVNETKNMYDVCEARRMTAVINGKDAQDYSCEREFAAFKTAFDYQLVLESKMPVGSQGQ